VTEATQEALAERLDMDRSTVTNLLRLLNLPKTIQDDIIHKNLSMGHARVLAGLKDPTEQKEIRDLIIRKGLSVRQVEDLVKKKKAPVKSTSHHTEQDGYFRSLADELKRSLGTKVDIKRRRGKQGTIIISFYSDEELERLLDLLS